MLRPSSRRRSLSRQAFTLMEMLVVVGIIVALASVALYNFLGTAEDAKVSITKTKIRNLDKAVSHFYLNNNRFPTAWGELYNPSAEGRPPILDDPEAVKDAWGNEFVLQSGAGKPIISVAGKPISNQVQ